jgi:purine-binding chemotaxis protein CheW
MSAQANHGHVQVCSFLVDGQLFGVDVTQVQEVIRDQPMTPVPLAPREVRGLINLRGQIVTAIDFRRRLGLSDLPADASPINVVIRHPGGTVSLLVDEIGDVVDVDETLFEPTLETLSAEAKALIRGIYKLSPRLLLLLDAERVIRVEQELHP